jgi:hypothetical protein
MPRPPWLLTRPSRPCRRSRVTACRHGLNHPRGRLRPAHHGPHRLRHRAPLDDESWRRTRALPRQRADHKCRARREARPRRSGSLPRLASGRDHHEVRGASQCERRLRRAASHGSEHHPAAHAGRPADPRAAGRPKLTSRPCFPGLATGSSATSHDGGESIRMPNGRSRARSGPSMRTRRSTL